MRISDWSSDVCSSDLATARKTSYANSLLRQGQRQAGAFAWYAPYYTYAAALQQALFFNLYVHKSGITPEQVGQIAVNQRRHAALNPKAIYKTPITLDDYLASPIIATDRKSTRLNSSH